MNITTVIKFNTSVSLIYLFTHVQSVTSTSGDGIIAELYFIGTVLYLNTLFRSPANAIYFIASCYYWSFRRFAVDDVPVEVVCSGQAMKARKVEGLCGASDESSVILFTTLSSVTCSMYISEFVICCVYFYFISCPELRKSKEKEQ